MERGERRLLVAVHAWPPGRTYVGIAPDATPSLEDEAAGAEIAPDVPGLALADALLCLVDGRGLRPHAAWATGVVALALGDAELRLPSWSATRSPRWRCCARAPAAAASCRRCACTRPRGRGHTQ